jgi:EAL domain-containing protein (putative c-di-GMP-specific phosphodiesterase class I)/DNA-binding NarL/FixJ family response regulator
MNQINSKNIKILIVEDELLIAQSLSTKLDRLGYQVLDTATTGEGAIQIAENAIPDIVLMDISIKGEMDGIEAATEIFQNYHIPVIYLTAYADDETVQRAEYSGAYGYILKPFRIQEIDATIRVAVQKHDQQSRVLESLSFAEELSTQLQNELKRTSLRIGGNAKEVVLEADLYKALERNQFQVYYQPLINLQTQKVIGAEALLRWLHPKLGLISPSVFIPIAERNHLISAIGKWVLQEACTQAKTWQKLYPTPLKVSVNLSPCQFHEEQVFTTVDAVLKSTGLQPELLSLEITEMTLMNPTLTLHQTIHDLKQLNIKLSFDDFGTGYSSLSYLQQFPFDVMKIDRSFVQNSHRDPRKSAIIQAILQLANSFNLDAIAEGVENQEEAQFLLQKSCDLAQGFLFSPPLTATDFQNFLASMNSGVRHSEIRP